MNRPIAEAAQTHAVLVGIEVYDAGSRWNLDGPARDLLDIYAWLRNHHVPATQIHCLASPLADNETALRAAGVAWRPATSGSVRDILNGLRTQKGDLLVLFWAGHGAIHDKQHRLFVADATQADKRNFEWDALRDSLASSYFTGFARQIMIVDACADFRDDFEFSAPGEVLPVGAPRTPGELAQFAFFATRPGETARNLGDEGRGLFSRELLRALEATAATDPSWPPDVAAVARRVQDAFKAFRTAGSAAQSPHFEWRDWDGNMVEVNASQPPRRDPASGGAVATLTFSQLAGLTNVLIACPQLATEAGRNDLLTLIRPAIGQAVKRRGDTKSDVMNIVQTAANYPGGLEEFLQLVGYYATGSIPWQCVEHYVVNTLQHLRIKLQPEA